ncbi:hypothetical protein LOC68_05455 [Blastopirellula sp. JC732]|uniref:Uncharacterized protein n=1 Tax=Blastopirellula sediminis TaxID=2894196 RepID=A0A9X1MJ84_9BACT|nr:hypothetical protein [Blastopirellula sediminis]MCC9609389.1 hypothetical protein [Blastopirellula sediminis]MCC9627834.1 hypothetical protein [Blastopirellula sediminis]
MNLDAVRLQIDLSSPSQSDAALEDSTDETDDGGSESNSEPDQAFFRRAASRGIPEDWFVQYDDDENWGFQLVIDNKRQRELEPGALDGLLEVIASDLHDLGAEAQQPCCNCQREATTLGYFESLTAGQSYATYCTDCWERLHHDSKGAIQVNAPQSLRQGWAALMISSILFAVVWGVAQHPAWGLPFPFLFMGCVGAGVAIAVLTAYFAQGSSLGLRFGVALCVFLATLAGNIVGIKFLLGPAVSWVMLVPVYFQQYFPAHVGQEVLFLSCGVVGVLIGFLILREMERLRVR